MKDRETTKQKVLANIGNAPLNIAFDFIWNSAIEMAAEEACMKGSIIPIVDKESITKLKFDI